MSQMNNYIDLTIESDEEAKTHRNGQGGLRLHGRPTAAQYGMRPATHHSRNAPPSLSSAASMQNLHARSLQASHHHPEPERRQTVASVSRPAIKPQIYMNHRELTKSTHGTQGQLPVAVLAQSRSKDKSCVNCAEVNVTCDGERPCSACVEPGLPCYYPGDKFSAQTISRLPTPLIGTGLSQLSISSQDRASQTRTSTSHSHFQLPLSTTDIIDQQSDLLPNRLLSFDEGMANLQPRSQNLNDDTAFDSDDSDDDDDVPLAIAEFEEVKRLLKKHEARMRDHRAYLLQPLLGRAKLDAVRAPQSQPPRPEQNPFERLIAMSSVSATAGTPTKSASLQLQVKCHKNGAPKKWNSMTVALKTIDINPTILPKYKSIGRLGMSLLAPNIRTLKYWPYFPDEENLDPSEAKKNEELEERYQHDDNHLLAQRKCSELVDLWQPWVQDFVSKLRIEFSDILHWYLHTADETVCDTCEGDFPAATFTDIMRLLTQPTERSLTLARLSVMALKDVAKVSMWHFVLNAPSVKDITKRLESPRVDITSLCSVCFLHNCLSHGAYQEPEETGGALIMGNNVQINDEEIEHNIRIPAAVPDGCHDQSHQCSLYCVAAEVRLRDILGQKKDGHIGGIYNHSIHVPRLTFGNESPCSQNCFWPVDKRVRFATVLQTKDYQPKLSEKSARLFKTLLRLYSDNQRVACMIAKEIDELSCIDTFYLILAETQRVGHYQQMLTNASQQGTRRMSKLAAGLDTTLSADLDARPPFVPCSHDGPCLNNPHCSCAHNKVHCEWFCGCDKSCDRRFPGCKCASTGKTCFNDKSCECWKHNRECDPWLCSACGVVEVLDPQNKYNDEVKRGRCKNNRIQLELPARTIKAPSEVQGWGLYAGTDLEEHAFIGEYKGETVGNQESDRRGAVYANIGQEYLFVMNRDQQIDGSNFGNKTRFINNSQREDYINVFAKKLLCNGVQRVMLYAKKNIKAGEELLYNYNYPVSVTKKFWERGEGPTSVSGAVVAKPSITWTQPRVNGRFARVAGKQDGEQSPATRVVNDDDDDDVNIAAAAQAKPDAKRKRVSEKQSSFGEGMVVASTVAVKHGGLFPDDPEDSDFELVEVSESSESLGAGEEGLDHDGSTTTSRRKRIIDPNDRRRGGLAQAKAWETRRKRSGKTK